MAFTPSVAFTTKPSRSGAVPTNCATRARAAGSRCFRARSSISIGRASISIRIDCWAARTSYGTLPKLPWFRKQYDRSRGKSPARSPGNGSTGGTTGASVVVIALPYRTLATCRQTAGSPGRPESWKSSVSSPCGRVLFGRTFSEQNVRLHPNSSRIPVHAKPVPPTSVRAARPALDPAEHAAWTSARHRRRSRAGNTIQHESDAAGETRALDDRPPFASDQHRRISIRRNPSRRPRRELDGTVASESVRAHTGVCSSVNRVAGRDARPGRRLRSPLCRRARHARPGRRQSAGDRPAHHGRRRPHTSRPRAPRHLPQVRDLRARDLRLARIKPGPRAGNRRTSAGEPR